MKFMYKVGIAAAAITAVITPTIIRGYDSNFQPCGVGENQRTGQLELRVNDECGSAMQNTVPGLSGSLPYFTKVSETNTTETFHYSGIAIALDSELRVGRFEGTKTIPKERQ